MGQNRNKLLDLFIGNISNVILHKILENAIDLQEMVNKYNKEVKNSLEIAKIYREKINPKNPPFPEKDIDKIKRKIFLKVKSELLIRISRGYKKIDFSLIGPFVEEALTEMKII